MFRFALHALFAFVLVLAAAPAGAEESRPKGAPEPGTLTGPYLAGQFIVATPHLRDPRFEKSVVYMVQHDRGGAMGLIVNKPFGSGSLADLLSGFGVEGAKIDEQVRLHYGGPVSPGSAFVLHSSDYHASGTVQVNGDVSVTSEMAVLRAVANGIGPKKRIFAIGYSGWGPGQLEGEIARGDWFAAPADVEVLFDDDTATKWERATGAAGLPL